MLGVVAPAIMASDSCLRPEHVHMSNVESRTDGVYLFNGCLLKNFLAHVIKRGRTWMDGLGAIAAL